MDYEMEELVPIVGKLAEKYTAYESSSITYEKAEQLMEAVLYCIHEWEETGQNALIYGDTIPAQKAYEMGAGYVEKKVKQALHLYHEILPEFSHYENQCLYDTFVKGLPEFFKWYDIRFEPQDTILTLDYPVLKDLSGYTGVDKIYEFIRCIRLEQKFLNLFPVSYITDILAREDAQWREAITNICEDVFTHVINQILAGKPVTESAFVEKAVKELVNQYYDGEEELLQYLTGAVGDILVRLRCAADNKGS